MVVINEGLLPSVVCVYAEECAYHEKRPHGVVEKDGRCNYKSCHAYELGELRASVSIVRCGVGRHTMASRFEINGRL